LKCKWLQFIGNTYMVHVEEWCDHWKGIKREDPFGVVETARVEELVYVYSPKERRIAILSVNHSLGQVFRLSDLICVLRRGQQIGVRETAKTDKN
jgi:ABC-type uncharacterized transport system ATPase subunit|tara:strand:- start:1361 stop:1645 length:285 start_codon:yes stop_codon:yes gene_type:complete